MNLKSVPWRPAGMEVGWRTATSIAAALLQSGLFTVVGFTILARTPEASSRPALRLFATWWFALAASTLLGATIHLLHQADALEPWLYQTITMTSLLVLSAALWCLMSYLTFLYTGSTRPWWIWGAFYAAFAIMIIGLIQYYPEPTAFASTGWRVEPLPAIEPAAWVGYGFLAALILPTLVACVALLLLTRHAQSRQQAGRIILVSSAIFLWFGTAFLGALLGLQGDAWQVTTRVLALMTASAVLWAYTRPA